jgi:hypothetical protein
MMTRMMGGQLQTGMTMSSWWTDRATAACGITGTMQYWGRSHAASKNSARFSPGTQ